MKRIAALALIPGLLIAGVACPPASAGQGRARTGKSSSQAQVPVDFAYPEFGESIEIEAPFKARSLSGIIVASNEMPMQKALVERVTPDFRTRLDAQFTDSNGYFRFTGLPAGKYFLRVSMYGMGMVYVRVIIGRKYKTQLKLALTPSA